MITSTQNIDRPADWRGNPCTVRKTTFLYGQERAVYLTYLNTENVWPVRGAALDFADALLYGNPLPTGD